ncbi:MAG TPA: DUF2190 family protein [Polyangiaceae bacterium]|nr:DUF2190 family protein [Polyangiaceae bacterium]
MGGSYNYPSPPVARKAAADLNPYRILKGNANDGEVLQSSAAADKHLGVSGPDAVTSGNTASLHVDGIVPVEYGGNVAVGDPLTSDANGKAVVATAGQRSIGFAQEVGDDGTIGSAHLAPHYVFNIAPGADGQVLTSTGTAWQSEVVP